MARRRSFPGAVIGGLDMRFLALLGVTVMVASGCKGATTSVAAEAVQRDIRHVLQQRLDALGRGDLEAYSAFLAEYFIFVDDDGHRMDKAATVKHFRGQAGHGHSRETEILVHLYGDAAVATYHQSEIEEALGSSLHGELEITETYVREKGRWLLAARQATPIPWANHPPTKVDPALYDEYAGNYQITPERIVTVLREGNKLYEKWPNDESKVEDVPLSETAFVQRGEASVLTFERDTTGKVVRFVVHLNSDDLVGVKVR
jgi:ketosteroid isomerase-like protein